MVSITAFLKGYKVRCTNKYMVCPGFQSLYYTAIFVEFFSLEISKILDISGIQEKQYIF